MARLAEVNPLILPPVYAEFRRPKQRRRNDRKTPMDAIDLMQFDKDTVFYDVFFNRSGTRLHAIGPPFLNLDKYLANMRLTINGEVTRFRLETLPGWARDIICLEAKLKSSIKEINTVEISFDNFEWSRDIKFSRAEKIIPLALTTLQRDNRIHWIIDWIKYYENILNVDQFIIYDNQSKYQDQLVELLPDNVLVVPWNSPLGITNCHHNKFLHSGQLNHSRLRYGEVKTFLNFDIDELLVIKDKRVKTFIRKFPTVIFDGYKVPYVAVDKKEFSYSDFTKRTPEAEESRKYSFNRTSISYNMVHRPVINKPAAKRFPSLFFIRVPVSQAYFLHYQPITTDWKAKTSRLEKDIRLRPWEGIDNLVSDYSVKNVLDDD